MLGSPETRYPDAKEVSACEVDQTQSDEGTQNIESSQRPYPFEV